MSAILLGTALSFISSLALWLLLGNRFALATHPELDSLCNLALYFAVLWPLLFALILFVVA